MVRLSVGWGKVFYSLRSVAGSWDGHPFDGEWSEGLVGILNLQNILATNAAAVKKNEADKY